MSSGGRLEFPAISGIYFTKFHSKQIDEANKILEELKPQYQ